MATGAPASQGLIQTRDGDSWTRLLRNPWVLLLLSPVASLIIGYLARDVLIKVSTAAYLGFAAALWLAALAYVKFYLDEPIRLLTVSNTSGVSLIQNLERLNADLTAEIGTTVIERALEDVRDRTRWATPGTAITVGRSFIPIKDYKMDEETLHEIESVIDAIHYVGFLRTMLPKARKYLKRAIVILLLWLPGVLIIGLFVAAGPQDLGFAFGLVVVEAFFGWLIWSEVWGKEREQLRRWEKRVTELCDSTYEELKPKVMMLTIEEPFRK